MYVIITPYLFVILALLDLVYLFDRDLIDY